MAYHSLNVPATSTVHCGASARCSRFWWQAFCLIPVNDTSGRRSPRGETCGSCPDRRHSCQTHMALHDPRNSRSGFLPRLCTEDRGTRATRDVSHRDCTSTTPRSWRAGRCYANACLPVILAGFRVFFVCRACLPMPQWCSACCDCVVSQAHRQYGRSCYLPRAPFPRWSRAFTATLIRCSRRHFSLRLWHVSMARWFVQQHF